VLVGYGGLIATTGFLLTSLPTGFVPPEDQGYLFVNVQLPDAASTERTTSVMNKLNEDYKKIPGVSDTLSIAGYSLLGGYAGSNDARDADSFNCDSNETAFFQGRRCHRVSFFTATH
jgi:HAE1 family hydrophobic/amphiphilic exporter-1